MTAQQDRPAVTTYGRREHARYERMRSRLVDLFRKHIVYKSTFATILTDLQELRDSTAYRKLPAYRRDMLAEVTRMWWDRINECHLDWVLGTAEGPIAEARTNDHDWSTGRLSELARTPGALYGAHYWRDSDRLYGEWKPTN